MDIRELEDLLSELEMDKEEIRYLIKEETDSEEEVRELKTELQDVKRSICLVKQAIDDYYENESMPFCGFRCDGYCLTCLGSDGTYDPRTEILTEGDY